MWNLLRIIGPLTSRNLIGVSVGFGTTILHNLFDSLFHYKLRSKTTDMLM